MNGLTVNRAHHLNQGRRAWWLTLPGLDAGPKWYDLVGSAHGTLTNMTTSASAWRGSTRPGGFGHLQFDGSDDRVAASGLAEVSGSAVTVALWLRLDAYDGTGAVLFGTNTGAACFYQILPGAGNTIYVSGTAVTVPATNWADGVWRRFALVASATATSVYVNGVLAGTGGAPTAWAAGAKSFLIGDWIGSPGTTFRANGSIDDVTAWSRTLSAADVRADHDESRAGYPGTLRRTRRRPATFFSGAAAGRFRRIDLMGGMPDHAGGF